MTFTATHIFAECIPCIKGETSGLEACTEVKFHPEYTLEQIQDAYSAFSRSNPSEPVFKPVAQPQKLGTTKWRKHLNWQ